MFSRLSSFFSGRPEPKYIGQWTNNNDDDPDAPYNFPIWSSHILPGNRRLLPDNPQPSDETLIIYNKINDNFARIIGETPCSDFKTNEYDSANTGMSGKIYYNLLKDKDKTTYCTFTAFTICAYLFLDLHHYNQENRRQFIKSIKNADKINIPNLLPGNNIILLKNNTDNIHYILVYNVGNEYCIIFDSCLTIAERRTGLPRIMTFKDCINLLKSFNNDYENDTSDLIITYMFCEVPRGKYKAYIYYNEASLNEIYQTLFPAIEEKKAIKESHAIKEEKIIPVKASRSAKASNKSRKGGKRKKNKKKRKTNKKYKG